MGRNGHDLSHNQGFRIPPIANLLDSEWNEAQFDTESRLPGEVEPVAELHYTPGNPRAIRVGITYLR